MKILALLRHAKSSWDEPALDDVDRPLSGRGRDAATRMGEEMRALGLHYDLALVSPARRAADTFERVCGAWKGAIESREEPRLYLAAGAEILSVIAQAPDSADRLLLVGHNPVLHEMAVRLSGMEESVHGKLLAAKFPTGALAEITLPIGRWADVTGGRGRLVRFLRPRDLR